MSQEAISSVIIAHSPVGIAIISSNLLLATMVSANKLVVLIETVYYKFDAIPI